VSQPDSFDDRCLPPKRATTKKGGEDLDAEARQAIGAVCHAVFILSKGAPRCETGAKGGLLACFGGIGERESEREQGEGSI